MTTPAADSPLRRPSRAVWTAWCLAAVFFFCQYAIRSCPAVMMPQLSAAFGLGAAATASLAGLFYYGYATFSLVAGAALDRFGARRVVPIGALAMGCGAILFGSGNPASAAAGRVLQGSGGAFAFIGTVYIASRNFPASQAATLIGAAQTFGMAGGSAGQFLVGPLVAHGVLWSRIWLSAGIASLVLSLLLFGAIPSQHISTGDKRHDRSPLGSLIAVFRNPQSILCGIIAGLLFIPTTIFDMTWGVRFLQEAHGFDYGAAVMRSSAVPLGWMIGAPLLGWVSDRIGRRKPVMIGGGCVLIGCLGWILYGRPGMLPPYTLGIIAGIASGAAMLPYTVIKELNPANLAGSAVGVANFVNLFMTALLGPAFGWLLHSSEVASPGLEHYQDAFMPLLFGVGLAVMLVLAMKETGPAVRNANPTAEVP